jgi:hypothetical protein
MSKTRNAHVLGAAEIVKTDWTAQGPYIGALS